MNKIQKIHDFLTEIQSGVSEKETAERNKIEKLLKELIKISAKDKKRENELLNELNLIHAYTKGQLYEIGYILENFWKIINEND